MRAIQENDGFKVVARDVFGSMFHLADGGLELCPTCGETAIGRLHRTAPGADGPAVVDESPPPVVRTTAGLPPRCAICRSGMGLSGLEGQLGRICGPCVDTLMAINL